MAGYFIYNGLNTANIDGFAVTGQDTYAVAQRNISHQAIPGRSGDILSDDGTFKQVKITYHCTIDASEVVGGINGVLEQLSAALLSADGYMALSDSYHPGIYRLAVMEKGVNVEALRPAAGAPHRVCNFDLSFSCRPQKYLSDGSQAVSVSSGGTVNNPTVFKAAPLLEIAGTGTVTIGSQTITVLSTCPASPVFIDCETMDAYSGTGANLNNHVQLPLADIVLSPGSNTITFSGVSSVKITPRTWKL